MTMARRPAKRPAMIAAARLASIAAVIRPSGISDGRRGRASRHRGPRSLAPLTIGRRRDGQLLAELDAPLVEGIDAPDRRPARRPCARRARRAGRGSADRAGGRRSVVVGRLPGKTLCGASALDRSSRALRLQPPRPRPAAAVHQRLGLGEAIGDEDGVMVAHARLVRLGGDQEIGRDDVGALVQQLVEGVLAVGAGLAPDERRRSRPRPSCRRACTRLPFDSMSSCCR